MTRKRIVIMPNLAAWIIGEMSKHIIHRFRESFDFFFVPESLVYHRPDLVATLMSHSNLVHAMNESATSLLVQKLGAESLPPVITWIHHVTSWSPEHDLSARNSCAITACTPGWARVIENLNPCPTETHVIRHGVDTDFFRPHSGVRQMFGIPADAFAAGFIAHGGSNQDNARKGFPVLMEIVRKAAAQIPNLHLLMLGPGWADPVRELRASGIQARYLDFLPRSAIPKIFSALDVYLMTSRVEGGPCTVLEAMACQTPVVATRVGLVPDVIDDGVNGFSAEVDDVETLTRAVLSIASDRARAMQVGANARLSAMRHTWHDTLSPLGELYERYARPCPATAGRTPAWMDNPDSLTAPAHAADVFTERMDRLRKNPRSAIATLRVLGYGLEGIGAADTLRGIGLLKRLAFPC